MPPNAELEAWRVSGISRTYPTYRRQFPITEERYVSPSMKRVSCSC